MYYIYIYIYELSTFEAMLPGVVAPPASPTGASQALLRNIKAHTRYTIYCIIAHYTYLYIYIYMYTHTYMYV